MQHGYTNNTWLDDQGHVRKRYQGRDIPRRMLVETACLSCLQDHLPVPRIISSQEAELVLECICGENGRELIERGNGGSVMQAAGRVLRRIHQISSNVLSNLPGHGPTIVHGDFGPHNILLNRTGTEVVAIIDWERAHFGEAIDDLAWFEWALREYQPSASVLLPLFFDGYGLRPAWNTRKAAMIRQCQKLGVNDPVDRQVAADQFWAQKVSAVAEWEGLSCD